MPLFEYYATFGESIELLRDLCGRGFRVIPGRLWDRPEASEYESVTEELVRLLQESPGLFLAGSFTRFPVQFRLLQSGPAQGKYVVDLLTQGPLMQSLLGRVNVVEGIPTVLPGNTSYQDEYKNPDTNAWERASAEVRAAYKLAVSTLKGRLVKDPLARVHISPEALRLVREGKTRLGELSLTEKTK